MTQLSEIRLREADAMECWAEGNSPEDALRISIARSAEAWIVEVDGEVLACWGWRTLEPGVAQAWMLSSPAIELHPVFAARSSRLAVGHILERHSVLCALVHEDYALSIRWLEWLGFTEHARLGAFIHMQINKGGRA